MASSNLQVRPLNFTLLAARLLMFLLIFQQARACQSPTGITIANYNTTYDTLLGVVDIPPNVGPGILDRFVSEAIPALSQFYETPIQFHAAMYISLFFYNMMSAYEPMALDFFGRKALSDSRRFCRPDQEDADAVAAFKTHRLATLAYALYWALSERTARVPQFGQNLKAKYEALGLDMDICNTPNACDDSTTPWGFAKLIADEVRAFFQKDGWNWDGSLSRGVNKIPFSDWRETPYKPSNSPWELRYPDRWQPLQETDGRGYISWQAHVTSHIGEVARSFFLGDNEVCARQAPDPNYDLDQESTKLLERMHGLTDVLKAEVEFFDGKFTSLVPAMLQFLATKNMKAGIPFNPDSWEFILVDSVIVSALYEATIVVWKEKVRHDKVRPPSYIHTQPSFQNADLQTYVVGEGARQIKGYEFEAYIRTMPHAEYPSGSSCACSAFEYAMIELYGDNIADMVQGGKLVFPVPAGSSRAEPGMSPAQSFNLEYTSFSQIAERCGLSRLDGGLHFEASVPAGRELCKTIGTKMAKMLKELEAGIVPTDVDVADFPNPAPMVDKMRCNYTQVAPEPECTCDGSASLSAPTAHLFKSISSAMVLLGSFWSVLF